jgi:hypothetical protein
MTTKTDIRKLLRGGLTGEEAGKLVIQDNWLVDRGKEGFLDKRDMTAIKSSLKTPHDIEAYNSYIKLYQLIDYTLKDAKILALEAQFYLLWIDKKLESLLKKAAHDWSLLSDIPAIVTQKQYEELKAKQKLLKLKQPITLSEFIEERADDYLEDVNRGDLPLEWKSAIQELLELIRAGKLTPLRLKDRQDYYDFYKREIDYLPAEDTVEKLDAWLAGELSEEEIDSLLEMIVFIGEELYQTGLPEWIEWIDVYIPNLDEQTAARPEGMMQSMRVAIIQNPKPEEIDERGFWIEKDVFSSKEKPDTKKDRETIEGFLAAVKERIKAFLSIQAVMDAISQIVGVDFSEDMRQWYETIESIVHIFNSDIESLWMMAPDWIKELGLEDGREMPYKLKIGRLKPTAKSLRYYQERMAIALGDDWMREAVESLEYEPQEEGSLAQEMADELAEALEKEAQDG